MLLFMGDEDSRDWWHPSRPHWTWCTGNAPGFIMVTVGMVAGKVLLQVTGKRTSPVRSQILPSPILPQKWHRRKIHVHWMTFWW